MRLKTNGVLSERIANLGGSFGGKRDVYDAAGYPQTLTGNDYLRRYERQDLAQRIIEIYAEETWRGGVELQDTEGVDFSPFEAAWNALTEVQAADDDGDTRPGILHYLSRADIASGLGRYSVILLGIADGKPLEEPAERGSLSAPEDFIYASVFSEMEAAISEYDRDVSSRRYGRPLSYNLKVSSGDAIETKTVHWSRVIHVAEKTLTNDLFGQPRLRSIYNRLLDIEKILASAGEGGWRLMNPSTIFATKDGYQLPVPDPAMPPEMQQALQARIDRQETQIDELVHGLRRAIALDGLEPHWQDVALNDPNNAVDAYLKMVSAATGIPLRVLIGSERGELASSQDTDNWYSRIESRRKNFAEAIIVRPLVNRLQWLGALPIAASGQYVCNWQPLQSIDQNAAAARADTVAAALQKIGAKVDAKTFVDTYLPELPLEAIENAPDEAETEDSVDDTASGAKRREDGSTPDSEDSSTGEAKANAEFLRRWAVYP